MAQSHAYSYFDSLGLDISIIIDNIIFIRLSITHGFLDFWERNLPLIVKEESIYSHLDLDE